MIEPLLEPLHPKLRIPLERMLHGYDIEKDVFFGRNVKIIYNDKRRKGKLHIGEKTFIGTDSIIDITTDVFIGSNGHISPAVKIFTHDSSHPPVVEKPVRIEDGVYLGVGAIVMPGVTIGSKAVIGPGMVVDKNVKAGESFGGKR